MKFLMRAIGQNHFIGIVAIFWILLFLMGGGARSDIQSLIILRPLSICFLAYGLWGLSLDKIVKFRFLFCIFTLSLLLILFQLLPLPYALWSNLPGRDLISDTDKIAGIGHIWRPLSMLPTNTLNALFAFLIPIAILVVLARASQKQLHSLLLLTIIVGLISAFLGLLQLIGPADGALYFYRITNRGTAVGLFANRNHHAVFLACIIPMLTVFSSLPSKLIPSEKFRVVAAGLISAFLLLLIIVSGSRAGLLAALAAIILSIFLYPPNGDKKNTIANLNFTKSYMFWFPIITLIFVAVIALLSSKATSFDRLIAHDGQNDLRYQVWGPIAKMAWTYFPFGSGFGTFAEVYKISEPAALLSPEYLNHAHNDLLETIMTGGLGAFLIIIAALCAWLKKAIYFFIHEKNKEKTTLFGRLGVILTFILALASIADYPLRTPSLFALFILASMWMSVSVKNIQRDG
jgi:O-antigen ligase